MLCRSAASVCAVLYVALGTLGVWLPGSARAAVTPVKKGTRLALVDLATPGTMMGLGAQVERQLESSAKELGYTVVPPSELQSQLGAQAWERLQKCEGQVACVMGLMRGVPADRVVVGSVNRDEKNYLIKLYLVDLRSGETIADVDRAILIASRRFKQDVMELVPRLLRGEREARGTLKIAATVKHANVWIDDEPAGMAPLEVKLKPGKYEVRLEKKSYLPVKRLVDVFANQTTTEEFRMILEPGGVPEEEEPPPPLAANVTKPADQGGIEVTTPAWIAFGAAAVAGGVGGYFGIMANRAEHDLQAGFNPATQQYAGTRARALQGQSDARTANILYGVAGAAAVTGVLFTVFDVGGSSGSGSVSATPSAGPNGAGVLVEGRF